MNGAHNDHQGVAHSTRQDHRYDRHYNDIDHVEYQGKNLQGSRCGCAGQLIIHLPPSPYGGGNPGLTGLKPTLTRLKMLSCY